MKFVFLSALLAGIFLVVGCAGLGEAVLGALSFSFDPQRSYDPAKARAIYERYRCGVCHGEEGEKRAPGSRILRDLDADVLKGRMVDFSFGGEGARVHSQAFGPSGLSRHDMDELIAHIKGVDFAKKIAQQRAAKSSATATPASSAPATPAEVNSSVPGSTPATQGSGGD